MVKKVFLVVSCFFVASQLFSESIPDSLLGIWEAKDRYVFFEQNNEEDPELVVVLKTYYGWYLDRAAEPASMRKLNLVQEILQPRVSQKVSSYRR